MPQSYHYLLVERVGDVFYVRIRQRRLDEPGVHALADEIVSLITDQGCRKLALSLGPEEPVFLYSVFLAKMVMIRRRLTEVGGRLALCDASANVQNIFAATRLDEHFDFFPNRAAAVAALNTETREGNNQWPTSL
jgi:anti-anti-sigma factor